MYIIEVTSRNRNDFQFIAYCHHCEKKSFHDDGYEDAMYLCRVFPNRACEHCGKTEMAS